MRYEQIKYQFDEIRDIVYKIIEEKKVCDLKFKDGYDRFLTVFSKILENRELFSEFLNKTGMTAKEIFVIILIITGCSIRDLSKPMSKELKTALKNKEIV